MIDQRHRKKNILILISFILLMVFLLTFENSMDNKSNAPAQSTQTTSTEETLFLLKQVAILELSDQPQFMTASTLHYVVEKTKAHAQEVNVYEYPASSLSSEPSLHLFSQAATYFTDTKKMNLFHPITIVQKHPQETFVIHAGNATYDLTQKKLTSQQPITWHASNHKISAQGMNVDFRQHTFELLGQVHTLVTFPQETK